MSPKRWVSAAMSSWLPVAGALVALLGPGATARAQSSPTCNDANLAVLPSPLTPWKGAPLRVVVALDGPLDGELSLVGPDGRVAASSRERHGGPPYFWFAEVAAPAAGKW